jgi:hypothetical protein
LIKKLVLVSALIGAAVVAQATEVGITGGRSNRDAGAEDTWGITAKHQIANLDVIGGFTRSNSADSYSIGSSKNVKSFGPVTVAVKGGFAYVDNKIGTDGYALVVGAGAAVPLNKKLAATVDYSYQLGQDRISSQNGNRVNAGVKFSF